MMKVAVPYHASLRLLYCACMSLGRAPRNPGAADTGLEVRPNIIMQHRAREMHGPADLAELKQLLRAEAIPRERVVVLEQLASCEARERESCRDVCAWWIFITNADRERVGDVDAGGRGAIVRAARGGVVGEGERLGNG